MTIVQEFIDRAKDKVNPSHLDWYTVTRKLTEANGFKNLGGVGGALILVNPSFDPDNVVVPGVREWMLQWHQWTGKFLGAPDLFFVWWNDPTDLKYLVDEGHWDEHKKEIARIRREEEIAYFAELDRKRVGQ